MSRVRLIHWNEAEAQERLAALKAAGHEVEFELLKDQAAMARVAAGEPEAIVIDLTRLPAQGRDLGIWLRQQKSTRQVPLVFVGGPPEKVERIRRLLPDAAYADWENPGPTLAAAIAKPPGNPVVPESAFAGYSGTPLPKKLGIKPGSIVALVKAPADFSKTLGPLPEGAELRPSGRGRRNLTICFVRSCKDLDRRMERLVTVAAQGNVWIVWPKKASTLKTDLSQTYVRRTGLDAGLVDFKICAIDEIWSGLCFALRRR